MTDDSKPGRHPFHSALEIGNIAKYAGNLDDVVQDVKKQLESHNIDTSPSFQELPKEETAREILVRLISLARGNGLYIILGDGSDSKPIVSVIAPNKEDRQLQSGHH